MILTPADTLDSCHPERSEGAVGQPAGGVEGSLPTRRTLRATFNGVCAVALAALREIFDEGAYSRFLTRNQLPASRDSYAAFCEENGQARAHRPRCC